MYFIQDNTFTIKYSIIIIAIIIVVVSELGTVKKGKLENIKKVSERATVKGPKRSACWDLHKSSGRCLVMNRTIDLID